MFSTAAVASWLAGPVVQALYCSWRVAGANLARPYFLQSVFFRKTTVDLLQYCHRLGLRRIMALYKLYILIFFNTPVRQHNKNVQQCTMYLLTYYLLSVGRLFDSSRYYYYYFF